MLASAWASARWRSRWPRRPPPHPAPPRPTSATGASGRHAHRLGRAAGDDEFITIRLTDNLHADKRFLK
ncbi:hypothetical protein GCM10018962_17120 [Dactylosporangium matsuzakiense]|uniref:Uncharacterized protein n=1 Tax=Dactylosporangium matsuzakiense TaxID=53360 RepID=A0A9W6KKI4_9ACTN|nr:hypothetical protein GCM10017581_035920 [Dactylosporangium matsuzakiense]